MVQRHISKSTTVTDVQPMLQLPPPPSHTAPISHVVNTNPNQSGAVFRRQGSHTLHQYTDNSVGHILAV